MDIIKWILFKGCVVTENGTENGDGACADFGQLYSGAVLWSTVLWTWYPFTVNFQFIQFILFLTHLTNPASVHHITLLIDQDWPLPEYNYVIKL